MFDEAVKLILEELGDVTRFRMAHNDAPDDPAWLGNAKAPATGLAGEIEAHIRKKYGSGLDPAQEIQLTVQPNEAWLKTNSVKDSPRFVFFGDTMISWHGFPQHGDVVEALSMLQKFQGGFRTVTQGYVSQQDGKISFSIHRPGAHQDALAQKHPRIPIQAAA